MKYKRILCLLLVLCLLAVGASAAKSRPRVDDGAGLLTEEQCISLREKLELASDQLSFDLVIVTCKDPVVDAQTFADAYYDQGGYLPDGALLLLDMGSRTWYVSTCGTGIGILPDVVIDEIMDRPLALISAENYAQGFDAFADACIERVRYAHMDPEGYQEKVDAEVSQGPKDPYGPHHDHSEGAAFPEDWPAYALVGLAAGLVTALIATGVMRKKLRTVHPAVAAGDYLRQGSMQVTNARDVFLYRTVSRVAKPQNTNNSSGGSHSGGVHVSSGGVSHGGHGGHF